MKKEQKPIDRSYKRTSIKQFDIFIYYTVGIKSGNKKVRINQYAQIWEIKEEILELMMEEPWYPKQLKYELKFDNKILKDDQTA